MLNEFTSILNKNLPAKETVNPSSTKVEDAPVVKTDPVDVKVEPKVEAKDEVKSDTPKVDKHSYDNRINAKHAEAMRYKEEAESAKKELDSLKTRLEALEKPKQPEELKIEKVEDLEAYLKTVATKDDLESLVSKMLDDRLSKAKTSMEQETREQSLKSMQNEFSKQLYDYYNPKNDVSLELDEDKKAEALQMLELFNSKPDLYLDISKKHGVVYLKKFIRGEFENENKAENLHKIIEKADAVKTLTDSNDKAALYEPPSATKSIRNIFEAAAQKLKR